VKTEDAVVITSVLQLHSLLATDDETAGRISPAGPTFINLQRAVHIGQRDFVKWLERDMINAYILSPDSSLLDLFLGSSPKMDIFLNTAKSTTETFSDY